MYVSWGIIIFFKWFICIVVQVEGDVSEVYCCCTCIYFYFNPMVFGVFTIVFLNLSNMGPLSSLYRRVTFFSQSKID